jgi:RNA polymerase primary sigma factor
MKVRAKLVLRNETMLSAREKAGLTQMELCEMAGIPIDRVSMIERLDFSNKNSEADVNIIALALDVSAEDIMPRAAIGDKIAHTHVKVCDVEAHLLPQFAERMALPSPVEILSKNEMKEKLEQCLHTLSVRERETLKLRFGIGVETTCSLEEVGRRLNITRERVRQIEARAIQKLQDPIRSRYLSEWSV